MRWFPRGGSIPGSVPIGVTRPDADHARAPEIVLSVNRLPSPVHLKPSMVPASGPSGATHYVASRAPPRQFPPGPRASDESSAASHEFPSSFTSWVFPCRSDAARGRYASVGTKDPPFPSGPHRLESLLRLWLPGPPGWWGSQT